MLTEPMTTTPGDHDLRSAGGTFRLRQEAHRQRRNGSRDPGTRGTTDRMRKRWRAFVVSACTVTAMSVAVPAAQAAQTATTSTNKCTVTAVAPTLSKTSLTGKATVVCTTATVVTVEIGVVEMDGTAEDTKVPIPVASKSMAVSANKAITISTAVLTCLNTETGNEEYASKARVNLSGTVSAWDRTVPKADSFVC